MRAISRFNAVVIAGLDPAIHSETVETGEGHGMDAMVKPWHDDIKSAGPFFYRRLS